MRAHLYVKNLSVKKLFVSTVKTASWVTRFVGLAFLLPVFVGCQAVYHTTGDVLIQYTEDHAAPYLLASDDPQMACVMSESMTPFLLSFETVTDSPETLKILLHMMSGQCALDRANEQELRVIRAVKAGHTSEAEDARILQKRYLRLSAKRQYASYQSMVRLLGDPGEGCPAFARASSVRSPHGSLSPARSSRKNQVQAGVELYWLVGLLSGLQAAVADLASEGAEHIPLDLPPKIARGMACLDNETWWGLPEAVQAAVWLTVPSAKPEGADPWKTLTAASALGVQQHVRLAQVLEARAYLAQGNVAQVKAIVRAHVESLDIDLHAVSDAALAPQSKKQTTKNSNAAEKKWRLFDVLATEQLLLISDQLWTEATGKRTPPGQFGSFWDDAPSNDDVEVMDLDLVP